MQITPLIVVVLLAGFGVVGDFFIKLSGGGSEYVRYKYFFSGVFVYALSSAGWFYVMKNIKLSSLGIIYSITTAILLTLLGVLFFKEQLDRYDIIGIFLGIISIVILTKFK